MGYIRHMAILTTKGDRAMNLKELGVIFIVIAGIILTGWVKNIVKLTRCDFKAPYKAEFIHGVGLLPPVGMITGWIDVKDGEDG